MKRGVTLAVVFVLLTATPFLVACQPRSAVVIVTTPTPLPNIHPTLVPFSEGTIVIQYPTNGVVVGRVFTAKWEDWPPLAEDEHYMVVVTATSQGDCSLQRVTKRREYSIADSGFLALPCGEDFSLQVLRMKDSKTVYASPKQLFVWDKEDW